MYEFSTVVQLFAFRATPKRWYLYSTYHTQYLYLVCCCTCCWNKILHVQFGPKKSTTMFPSTSCRNPLCPIPYKVFRKHAEYSHHCSCSTGCLHYIQTGWSAIANQCPPSSHIVTTSTKSAVLMRSRQHHICCWTNATKFSHLQNLFFQPARLKRQVLKQTTTPRSDQRQCQTINHLLTMLMLLKRLQILDLRIR